MRIFPEHLRNRDFRRLWLSNGFSWQGFWMELLVLGWLALELTNAPWKVAFLGFIRSLPLLLGAFTSVITDRFSRRNLLVALQLVIIGGIGILVLLSLLGALRFWHIAAVSFINGTVFTLDWPTRRALFPDLVGREHVIDAMLLENINVGASWFIGPLAGGALLHWFGASGALLVTFGTYGGSLVMLLRLKTSSRAPSRATGWADAARRMREGLRYVRGIPRIGGVLLFTVLMNAWVFPFHALVPVFARDVLGTGPLGMGILAGSYGLGVLIGLGLVHRGRQYMSDSAIFFAGCMLCGAAVLCFSFSVLFSLSLLLVVVAGVGHASFSTMQTGIALTESSDDMRGRVMAVVVLAIGGGLVGSLQCLAMVAAIGAPLTVAIMSLSAVVGMGAVAILLPGFVRTERRRGGRRGGGSRRGLRCQRNEIMLI